MTEPNDPAFGTVEQLTVGTINIYKHGLTKREYFASLALQGLVTQLEYSNVDDIADTAVQYADALIASLNKQPPQKGGRDE